MVVSCDSDVSWIDCVPGARPASSITLIPSNGSILCIGLREQLKSKSEVDIYYFSAAEVRGCRNAGKLSQQLLDDQRHHELSSWKAVQRLFTALLELKYGNSIIC